MRRSFRTRGFFAGGIPRVCTLGWYAMPPQGMGSDTWLAGPVSGTRWGSGIGHVVGAHGIGNALDDPLTDTRLAGPVSGTRWAHGIETVIVQYALNGHRIPAQGIALGTAS